MSSNLSHQEHDVDIRCWHMWSWWPIMNNFVIKNSACTASRSSARPLPVHLLQSCGRETPHLGVFSIPQPGNPWLQWDLNHRRGCQNWPLNRGGTRAQSKINLFLLNCWVLLSCVECMPNWYIWKVYHYPLVSHGSEMIQNRLRHPLSLICYHPM